jgi:hypothetical protein
MPKKTCQLGLRRTSALMIEFLWCLVIQTWSPVWNQITKDMKSINTQSATFRVIHASARMFSNFYWTSPLACLDRRSQIVSPGQFTSPVVQPAAALEKWNQSRCRGPVWRGDLWKQFIYWWLLSPRDLRISFRIQDCVKLKPQMASKPYCLGCLFTIRSLRAVVLCIPLINIRLCRSDTIKTLELVEARYLSDGRSAGACKYFMYKSSSHCAYQDVVSVKRPPFYKRESASMTFLELTKTCGVI